MKTRVTFSEWLQSIPPLLAVLTSAIAAVLGLLAPERLIPEPLADYRWIPSVVVLLSFILYWAWRAELTRLVRALGVGTAVVFVVVVVLNVLFVRAVRYNNPPDTVFYLTGLTVADPSRCGPVPEVIIRQCGGEWSALTAAWGKGFMVVALAYILAYIALTVGLTLALGATITARSPSPAPSPTP